MQPHTSPSQPMDTRSIDRPTSPPPILPTPTPTEPNGNTITVTPSPSPTAKPGSTLKLNLYRTYPTQSQQVLRNIDWSMIVPGQKRNSPTVYFRNEGNVPLTMYFAPSDWVFKDSSGNALPQNCSNYFTLTWNYNNSPLEVNEVRAITFTLAVSPDLADVATFSFNLVVTITSTM
jgi:hypothetical protein